MKTLRRSFKYRAKINKATEANADRWLWICRTLYNDALAERIWAYRSCQPVSITAYQQSRELPDLKREFPHLKQVGAQTLQDVIERLDRSFQNFFRRVASGEEKPGFPRFKGRHRYNSFTLKQSHWKLEGRYLYVTGVGRFKLFLSRPIEGDIKTITISRTGTGKWFVSFSCDNVPAREFPEADSEVGIDVGLKHFLVDSDGVAIENPRFFKHAKKLLRRRQRALSRKKKGSRRRQKARRLVAKTYEQLRNRREDFAHKLALDYVRNNRTICIEKLNIKGMVRNRYLAQSISDAAWGKFFDCVLDKAEEAGREAIQVSPHNTTQNCSACGEKVPKTLSVRVHSCPFCGFVADRDENAALNILSAGQADQALTTSLGVVA